MDDWKGPETVPEVKPFDMKEFVVAVFRKRTGKVYTFSATYLNKYPLNYQDCICKPESDHTDDGCPTSGWCTQTGDDDEGSHFHHLHLDEGDRVMGWCQLPQWTETKAA